MTTKIKTVFACQACGFESSKWLGRCPDCGEWNSFVEERQEAEPSRAKAPGPTLGGRPQPYDMVDGADAARIPTGLGEFDRVLGGGIVPGSMVLIGGEPGVGKSTLMLGVAHLLSRSGGAVLYVSGEESPRQIKLRGERLGVAGGGLYLMGETSLERILEEVDELKPSALVVDSVQTVYSSKFPSAPGSISQVREVATQLLFLAKGRGITTFLIGHVTKDGSLAGPKSLEHIVDTVLYFEGEKRQHHRIVRAVKNRFGAVS
jgi:DNA repair protein RadA/Sms